MMLVSPSLQPRIVHTTHRCSGRLFLVHLRHGDEDLIIVALYGVSAPTTDDRKFMRAQLADALTQIVQEYDAKPFIVVGDYTAAASPEDRGTGKLLPYDTAPDAPTVILMRLSLTDVYRHKFPQSKHYTWSNSRGQKSRIDAVYANDIALDKAGGINNVMSAIGKPPGPLGRFRCVHERPQQPGASVR